MASLLAHIGLGLIVALILRTNKKSLVLFGSILPDIKIFLYALATPTLGLTAANELIIPIHSPLGGLLLAVFFSSLLPKERFREAMLLMVAGLCCHFILDASIYPFSGIEHYLLLYPFSWTPYGLEASEAVNIFTLLCLPLLLYFILKKRNDILKNISPSKK
jgi:membrane-bound metal-dependent hydrolase YbcI (DUF457 family)